MDLYCRKLPKIELHAHLNGSLSKATILQLKRYYADSGLEDKSNVFFDDFQYGAGDIKNLTECFKEFALAHSLTTTPEALRLATSLTLQEFCEDGCSYIELRSTPRDTQYMNKRQYIETIIEAMQKANKNLDMTSRFIVSINRSSPLSDAEKITDLAIEYYRKDSDVVVGIELSGNPLIGNFKDFVPCFKQAKEAGLKISLHCGEVCNPNEVLEMLHFRPDRIGHGTCIHPKHGGTEETWTTLCDYKIPVEVCLTSNVISKSTADYSTHHFKELTDAEIPTIICTDDKGIFYTSLSQEYRICAETFNLDEKQLSTMVLNSCQYVFAEDLKSTLVNKVLNFVNKKI